jgi:hypothetical protein
MILFVHQNYKSPNNQRETLFNQTTHNKYLSWVTYPMKVLQVGW